MSVISNAQRDIPDLSGDELIRRYESGITDLESSVRGMKSDQLRMRPVADQWSTLEVVCHLTDAEQFFAERMKRTIAVDRPLLIGVDNPQYLIPLRYQQQDLDEQLALFRITRQQMARTLRLMDPSAWQRTAIHSETGLVTLRQHPINHVQHHLRFILQKRAAMNLKPTVS